MLVCFSSNKERCLPKFSVRSTRSCLSSSNLAVSLGSSSNEPSCAASVSFFCAFLILVSMLVSAAVDWLCSSSAVSVVPPKLSMVCAEASTCFASGSYCVYNALILAVSPAVAASCSCVCKPDSLILRLSYSSIARFKLGTGGAGGTAPVSMVPMTAPGRTVSLIAVGAAGVGATSGTVTGSGATSGATAGATTSGTGVTSGATSGITGASGVAGNTACGAGTGAACAAASCSAACLAATSSRAAPFSENLPTAPKGPSKPA